MACGMLALNIVLIPKWGIVGAAVGAALTNAVTNVWYLAEVRRPLGVLPYSRSYWRLLLPVCGNLAVLLMVRTTLKAVRPEWIVISAGISLAYLAFIAIAMAFGPMTSSLRVQSGRKCEARFKAPRETPDVERAARRASAGRTLR
jgi:O-antigen/teichoic acid export membrane protein